MGRVLKITTSTTPCQQTHLRQKDLEKLNTYICIQKLRNVINRYPARIIMEIPKHKEEMKKNWEGSLTILKYNILERIAADIHGCMMK